jgi:hypothetical protein
VKWKTVEAGDFSHELSILCTLLAETVVYMNNFEDYLSKADARKEEIQ